MPPDWCIEYVPGIAGLPLAAARTLFRSLFPLRFWSEHSAGYPVRPGRLIAYAALLGMVLYITVAATMGIAALRCWPHSNVGEFYRVDAPASAQALRAALAPLSDRSAARVIPFDKPIMTGTPILGAMTPRQIAREIFFANPPVRRTFVFITALALLCPLSYAVLARLAGPSGGIGSSIRSGPVSHHLARIFVYGLGPWAIAAGFIIAAAPGIYGRYNGFPVWHYEWVEWLVVPAFGLFMACWWGAAARWYLRMDEGWAVGIGAAVVALAIPGAGASVVAVVGLAA